MSQSQIEQRLSLGDRLEVPREVEHFSHFRRKAAAASAADELIECGYSVFLERRGLKLLVVARKESAVEPPIVEAFVREVFDIVESHGGDYDGWGGETR